MTFTITLPAPGRDMGANGGGANRRGRFASQKASKTYKAMCEWAVLLEKKRLLKHGVLTVAQHHALPLPRAHVAILWLKGPRADETYHPRDEDNARTSLKPAMDSLVTQGLLKDDSRKTITTEFDFGETVKLPGERVRPPSVAVFTITLREESAK